MEQRQARKLVATPKPHTNAKKMPVKADDDEPKPNLRAPYSSPEYELRDVYRTKTGLEMPLDLLSRLKETCEIRGVTLAQYTEAIRPHTPNAWHNPAGFMTDFARKIHSKTPGWTPTPGFMWIDPNVREIPRCNGCSGVGIKAGEYCNCQLGQDLKRQDQRRAGKAQQQAQFQQPELGRARL